MKGQKGERKKGHTKEKGTEGKESDMGGREASDSVQHPFCEMKQD